MKKRIVVFLIFVILTIIGCVFLVKKNEQYRQEKEIQAGEEKVINIKDLEPVEKGEPNKDKEKIKEQIESNEKVFLYFYATWCPMCQKTEPIMAGLIEKYPDIIIIQIDTDIEKDLKNEYDVHNVPTLILIEKNTEIDRIVEELDADKIEEFITK